MYKYLSGDLSFLFAIALILAEEVLLNKLIKIFLMFVKKICAILLFELNFVT